MNPKPVFRSQAIAPALIASLALAAAPSIAAAWSLPAAISGDYASSLSLTMDGKGRAVAVWLQYDGGFSRVYSSIRSKKGEFSAAAALAPGGMYSLYPTVASNKKGKVVAAWVRDYGSGGPYQVEAADLSPKATAFGNPVQVSTGSSSKSSPSVGMDTAGDVVAVWSAVGSPYTIDASTRPAGGDFDTPVTISPAESSAYEPLLTMDASGNAFALWRSDDGGAWQTTGSFRPAGGSFETASSISPPMIETYRSAAQFDPKGNLVALEGAFGNGIHGLDRPKEAGFGTPYLVDGTGYVWTPPVIRFDKKLNMLAGWVVDLGPNYSVRVVSRSAAGDYSLVSTLSTPGMDGSGLDLAFDKKGNARAVWAEFDGFHTRIRTALRPAGGDFGTPEWISPGGVDAFAPKIVFDKKGSAVVYWQNGMDAGGQLMVTVQPK